MKFKRLALDILGEIGNVSFGNAGVSLSNFINRKIAISLPEIQFVSGSKLENGYEKDAVYAKIEFDKGLRGTNLLVVQKEEAKKIVALTLKEKLDMEMMNWDDFSKGVMKEIFNIMVGNMSSELSNMLNKEVSIKPFDLLEGTPENVKEFENEEEIISMNFDIRLVEEGFKVKVINILKKDQAESMINILAQDNGIEGEEIWNE